LGDAEQLQALLENLIGNVIKYSGRVHYLRLTVRSDDAHAIVEVADRGIGIPLNEQRQIFKKFYRIPQAGHGATTGSGLGLAIVDHICQAHGGRVVVESAVGVGSTFRVELPLLVDQGEGQI
jgi:two-component system phosphate regulon sensor histidine kinase PhoR